MIHYSTSIYHSAPRTVLSLGTHTGGPPGRPGEEDGRTRSGWGLSNQSGAMTKRREDPEVRRENHSLSPRAREGL